MLKELQQLTEYDSIFFIPHEENENQVNISSARYKEPGEYVGGTVMGDFFDIILFRMNENDDITDLDRFQGILVDPRVYVSRMVKDDWYGLVAKKTTTSDKFVNDVFDNWSNLSYNVE